MNTDLILQTILLNIDLLASPSGSGNSLTEAARASLRRITMDLIYDLFDLGKIDSVAFRSLDDQLSIAFVHGGL